MNKNLKKLIDQVKTDTSGKWMDMNNVERLSELIIRECADVAAEHDALDIYEEIREHFDA
jgi:hypothetical protein